MATASATLAVVWRFGARSIRPPTIRRQVPRRFYGQQPKYVTELLWGADMGTGFSTYASSWSWWTLVGLMVASGSPALGMVAGGGFGALRGIQPVLGIRLGKEARTRFMAVYRVYFQTRAATAMVSLGLGLCVLVGSSMANG